MPKSPAASPASMLDEILWQGMDSTPADIVVSLSADNNLKIVVCLPLAVAGGIDRRHSDLACESGGKGHTNGRRYGMWRRSWARTRDTLSSWYSWALQRACECDS